MVQSWVRELRAIDEARFALNVVSVFRGSITANRQCLLPVTVSVPRPDDAVPRAFRTVKAIFSTGASRSAVSVSLARELGLPLVGPKRAKGASAVREFDAAIEMLDAQERPHVSNCRLIGMTVGEGDPQVVMGMELLEGGIFTVDHIHAVWDWRYVAPDGPGPE